MYIIVDIFSQNDGPNNFNLFKADSNGVIATWDDSK